MATQFDPPGPGYWTLDRSHYVSGTTPISQWLLTTGFDRGFRRVFEELGVPLAGIEAQFVNNFFYTRVRPLIGGDSAPRKLPPNAVTKLVTHVHPQFRARNKTAIAALRDRPSNKVVQRWQDQLKPELVAFNREAQQFDVGAANDVELQGHITALLDKLVANFELHFWLHGHDLGPIARYLKQCIDWGLDPVDAISALAGASPATAEPIEQLIEMRALLESSAEPIVTLDDFRASSREASHRLDAYLDERGFILATGYDLDARTLNEMPEVVLTTIRTATAPPTHNADGIAGELRNTVPTPHRDAFDQALADARNVMDMRDDNGPLTLEWPVGLLRRALLAAGDRLVQRGALAAPEHALEVTPDEARSLFGGTLPSSDALAKRAETRRTLAALEPPESLGEPSPEPPLDVLPPALAELSAAMQVAMKYVGMDDAASPDPMSGAGIGSVRYVGTARVAQSADQALDELEPGDVLIVRATSPAFNAVLAIAGAVVTSDGGVLSHAAVLARELGIPAVIGVTGALDIKNGATVEVDPAAGLVLVHE